MIMFIFLDLCDFYLMFPNYVPLMMSYDLYKFFYQGWNELFGGQGSLKKNSMLFHFFQNNSMQIYLVLMFLWLIVLFMFMLI